ncbi:hypothetical protein CEE44_03785 [Candidatus Woesearchaeota archaeon B3_Woes]|nr:MAG: hypothetical protein CEE44_03785 [Candidatus Woesearchaeota archaeon B3_Woes]
MSEKNIAIVVNSGRKFVNDLVSMLTEDLERFDHFDNYEIHLIISYDPTFYNLKPTDFRIEQETSSKFDSVTYLGPESYLDFSWVKTLPDVTDEAFSILFEPRGYCSQKNRAILDALLKGVEHILFLDDDEYFVAPFQNGGMLDWVEQDVFGAHLQHNSDADITNGAHTGYFSPIPSDIEYSLEEEVRRTLGEIFSIGNEVIDRETFINIRKSIIYGDDVFLRNGHHEIPEKKGVRTLSGGNITLNASSIRSGKIPPYYNPYGARGEDAILGMQIPDLSILKIPVYTFHDPFQKYWQITQRQYPEEIEPIEVIPGTIDRFCKACIGWIKYAPFLIQLTSQDEQEYRERIAAMEQPLKEIGSEINRQLNWKEFDQMAPILLAYDSRSRQDIQDLKIAKGAWAEIVQHC